MRKLALGLGTLALVFGAFAEEGHAPAAAPAADRTAAAEHLAGFWAKTTGGARVLPASEVRGSIDSGNSKYYVVDVRSAEEYKNGHIPGAVNMPMDELFRPANLAKLPAANEKPIVLVCNSGHMASMALGGLASLGYEPYVMRFGMIGWNAESKVKAGSSSQQPDTVHGVGGPIEK